MKIKLNCLNPVVDKLSVSSDCTEELFEDIIKHHDKDALIPFDPSHDSYNTAIQPQYYKKGYMFRINDKPFSLLFTESKSKIYLNSFHPVTMEQQLLFNEVFLNYGILPKVSCLELAFDFYVEDHESAKILKERIVSHINHPYKRQELFIFENTHDGSTTIYTSKRSSAKFIKIYIRPFPEQNIDKGILPNYFVRVELTLRRPILKRLVWTYPLSAETIRSLDIIKFLSFYDFDDDGFFDFYFDQNKWTIRRKWKIKENFHKNPKEFELYFRSLPYLKKVEELGKIKNKMNFDRFKNPRLIDNLFLTNALRRLEFVKDSYHLASEDNNSGFIYHKADIQDTVMPPYIYS